MQQENADLIARVSSLEEEVKSLNVQLDRANEHLLHFQRIKRVDIGKDDGFVIHETNEIISFRETCNFCDPMRCRACEKRIQMLPSIIPIILKNDFIGVRDLAVLACASHQMRQYICFDSDDDIWSSLLHEKWPSTYKIPQQILSRLSFRSWYERLATAVRPGAVEWYVDYEDYRHERACNRNIREELISRRQNLRQEQLRSITSDTDEEEFPRLAAPSLAASDILFLVDLSFGGKGCPCISSAMIRESSSFLSLLELPIDDSYVSLSKYIRGRGGRNDIVRSGVFVRELVDDAFCPPVRLQIYNDGEFFFDLPQVCGSIYAVRLTDMKVICLSKILGCETSAASTELLDEVIKEESCETLLESKTAFYGDAVGSIPTLLTSRIRYPEGNEDHFCDFQFIVKMSCDTPRSPRHFGHKYTVEQFQASHDTDDFAIYSLKLWNSNAANKPELQGFFKQAEDAGAVNGMYFGKLSKIDLCTFINVEGPDASDGNKDRHIVFNGMNGGKHLGGVTLLHVLENLFDHNEPPLDYDRLY